MMPGMPDYLIPKAGDQEATHRLRKFMVMMDSMSNRELDGLVDLNKKHDPKTEARIHQIAAGSGSHPNEVKMLLACHQQNASMVAQMGKSGIMTKAGQAKQQQMTAMLKKNPNLIQQRVNQMDPKQLQQLGGRDAVLNMLQQMSKGGGGGAPSMESMMSGMSGGLPGGMSMPAGMDMEQMMNMAKAMGMAGTR
jgi:signal recognition particle subunit SRP54